MADAEREWREVEKGYMHVGESHQNSDGIFVLHIDMLYQLSGPLEASVHLHGARKEKARSKSAYILRVSLARDARLPLSPAII